MASYQEDWRTRPSVKPCTTCGILIFWNSPLQLSKGEKKPYNLMGTKPHFHSDPEEARISKQEQPIWESNAKGYTPPGLTQPQSSNDYNPRASVQPDIPYKSQVIVSNPISSSLTQEQMVEKIVSMEETMQGMSAKMDAMYTIMHEYINHNPVAATLSGFISDMIRGKENKLVGFRSAEDLKDGYESMSNSDIDPDRIEPAGDVY